MAENLTEKDLQYLKFLKTKGVSKDQAFKLMSTAKQKASLFQQSQAQPAGPQLPPEIAEQRGIGQEPLRAGPAPAPAITAVKAGVEADIAPEVAGPALPKDIAAARGIEGVEVSEERVSLPRLLEEGFVPSPERREPKIAEPVLPVEEGERPEKLIGVEEETIKEFATGALKSIPKTLAGLSELGQQGMTKIANFFGADLPQVERPEALKEFFEADTTAEKVGGIAGDIAQFFIPAAALSKAPKAIQALKGFNKLPSIVKGILTTAPEAAAIGTLAAGQEGKIGPSAAIATGLPFVGAGLANVAKRLGNFVFSSAIPSTITQRGKDITRGLDIGEALSKTGVSPTRGALVKRIEKQIASFGKVLGKEIDDAAKLQKGQTFTMKQLTKGIKEKILKDPAAIKKLGATPVDIPKISQTIDEVLKGYTQLFKGKPMGLKEVQSLKVALGRGLEREFNKAIGAAVKAKPLTEIQIRTALKKTIEDIVPRAAEINKKLAPLFEASGRLAKKASRKGLLTDLLAGAIFSGGGQGFLSNPGQALQNFAFGVLAKRGALSTAGRTSAGSAIKLLEKSLKKPEVLQGIRVIVSESLED